jgi:hypothetical protein
MRNVNDKNNDDGVIKALDALSQEWKRKHGVIVDESDTSPVQE